MHDYVLNRYTKRLARKFTLNMVQRKKNLIENIKIWINAWRLKNPRICLANEYPEA